MDQLGEAFDLDIEWKLVELHPETPVEGRAWDHFSQGRLDEIFGLSIKAAKEHGFKLKMPPRMFNSRKALQAAAYAKDEGKFDEFHEAILESIFLDGKDIGNWTVLSEIAESCDLNAEELKFKLDEGGLMKRLDQVLIEKMVRGCGAIPTTFVAWQRVVGAVPLVAFREMVLNFIKEMQEDN